MDYNNNGFGKIDKELAAKRQAVRITCVVLVTVCTVFLAVMAGMMIALWDMGKSSADLFQLLNGTYVENRTQVELARVAAEAAAIAEEKAAQLEAEKTAEEKIQAEASEIDENMDEEESFAADNSDTGDIFAPESDNSEDTQAGGSTAAEAVYNEENGSELQVVNEVALDGSQDDTATALNAASNINVFVDPNVNYPKPFTTVNESYFNDALFIGDSRLQGFGMYSGLPGTYYCATGFQLYKYETMKVVNTGSGKVPILNALPYDTFTKIYIKVGLNEMGGNDSVFASKYSELIAKLRQSEPRAIIYIHGLLPVTAAKSQSDKVHNNTNVSARNAQLQQLALQNRAYYLDAGSALAGPDGALPAEMAADGIHLKAKYMGVWKQYLMTHAVSVP